MIFDSDAFYTGNTKIFGLLFSSSESEFDSTDLLSRVNEDRCLEILVAVQICDSILERDDPVSLQGPLTIIELEGES
jgi:hypothetical protein